MLERIENNSLSVKNKTKLCSLFPGAGSGLKVPGAGAVPKQAGSETLLTDPTFKKKEIRIRIFHKKVKQGKKYFLWCSEFDCFDLFLHLKKLISTVTGFLFLNLKISVLQSRYFNGRL